MSNPYYIVKELTAYELLNALSICSQYLTQSDHMFDYLLVEKISDSFHHYYNLFYPFIHSDPQIKGQFTAITRKLGGIYQLNQSGRASKEAKRVNLDLIVNALFFLDQNDKILSNEDNSSQAQQGSNAFQIGLHLSKPLHNEPLLILPSADRKQIIEVGKELQLTKTTFNFALANNVTFFHLKYQPNFYADPSTYLATDVGQSCQLFSTHNVSGKRIFVPSGQLLYKEKLLCFVDLVEFLYPNQFSSDDEQPFAALIPVKKQQYTTTYLNLANLCWYSPLALEPVQNKRYILRVHDFAQMQDFANQQEDPDDNKRWRERFGFSNTDTGYKISLVEAPKTISDNKQLIDEQREQLRRQQDEITYKLTYLDSIQLKSPILRRFSQRQLLQLADFLRSFSIIHIKEGRIKYAFSETDQDPAGLHYFMYDPGNAIIEAFDAFRIRDCDDNRCTRFTIDPMWDSIYHNSCKHKIYVPENKIMYPPLLGWSNDGMDQYMRTVMDTWFPDIPGRNAKGIPEYPIYLFEHYDEGGSDINNKIWVSILDETKFAPFHERLGFFNDNLELIYEQYHQTAEKDSMAAFTGDMASKLKRKQIAQQITADSTDAQALFEESAHSTAQAMADTFDQLLVVFSEKTQSMQDEVTELTDYIRQQNKQLIQLNALAESMKKFGHQLQVEDTGLQTNLQDIDKTVEKMTQKIDSYISTKLDPKKREIDQKVQTAVNNLHAKHSELNDKISSLW